jgi:hypothetical protein
MHGQINSQRRAVSQARELPPFEKSFANETPEQRVWHREVAWRDRQRKRRRNRRSNPKTYVRIRELERLFADRYGPTLPNDDAGLDDIFVMANHLAHLDAPDRKIMTWLRRWAPWHDDDSTAALIRAVTSKPLKWRADALAERLGLDYATRTRLKITTIGAIDCGKAKRAALRRKRAAARERARRAKSGAVAHASSAARAKPWKALGISRRTYFRRQREKRQANCPTGTGGTNSCAACPQDIVVDAKQSHDDAQDARCARSIGPEFRVSLACDAGRFTINVPVKFRAVMSRRSTCIVAAANPNIRAFLPRTVVAARIGGGDAEKKAAARYIRNRIHWR